MVKDQPTGAELPDGIPSYPARPAKFMIKLLAAWAAMGFSAVQGGLVIGRLKVPTIAWYF